MYNQVQNGFKLEQVSVPSDGSCFFTSISVAMFDSIETWGDSSKMRKIFKHHWSRYSTIFPDVKEEMSANFIRYLSASAIDEHSLLMSNEEAKILKRKQFKRPEEFARHILYSSCWADQGIIRSFMKSLHYMVGLVIIESENKRVVYMPPEWTKGKEFYICVCLDDNHYTPISVEYKEEKVGMCMSKEILEYMLDSCDIKYSNKF